MKILIKGRHNETKGMILEQGDRKTITDPDGAVLGYYVLSQDKTYTRSGRYIGDGDQTMTLLR